MRAQLDKIHLSSIRAISPRTMRAEVTLPNRLPQGGPDGTEDEAGTGPDGTGAGKGPDEAGEGSGGGHTESPGRDGTGKGPARLVRPRAAGPAPAGTAVPILGLQVTLR